LLNSCQRFLGSSTLCKVAGFNLTSLDTHKYPDEVAWEVDQNSREGHEDLAKEINADNNVSAVILQHEYGIFGGQDGENILTFMRVCKKPILVTLHTVLPSPSDKMREVTSEIIELSKTVIVLTTRSKELVESIYPNSVTKIFVIPHGIHPVNFSTPKAHKVKVGLKKNLVLSTFGLLSSGKGVEYAIKALPKIIKKYPSIVYLILGQTHPVVLRNEGEKYRISLARLVTKLGLEKHVKFYDQYLRLPELFEFLKSTDIYMSLSINPNQAVSGTLSYALGSGRAVISTEFAQAKEIVTPEIGSLVPIKDSKAIANAVLHILSDTKRLNRMHLHAYESTRYMLWSNVAEKYLNLLGRTAVPTISIAHLETLTDKFGLFQFASLSEPNTQFGYTLDDNARAAIVCGWLTKQSHTKELERLIGIYLEFIKKCQDEEGRFINYIAYKNYAPSSQNKLEDLEDAQARALWALSEIMSNTKLSSEYRAKAKEIFLITYKNLPTLTHLRSMAYAIKSFALVLEILPEEKEQLTKHIKLYADTLMLALKSNADKSWHWFENHLSYNNGLLSEGLLVAGSALRNAQYKKEGLETLQFLIGKTFSENTYMPIGQSSWYKNYDKRSKYDQQPEDPASMILALARAFAYTHNQEYKVLAEQCFGWFLGKNSLNISLYDAETGGCYDGLHPDRVNLNQGAESLVSYLMANVTMAQFN